MKPRTRRRQHMLHYASGAIYATVYHDREGSLVVELAPFAIVYPALEVARLAAMDPPTLNARVLFRALEVFPDSELHDVVNAARSRGRAMAVLEGLAS